jgi:hypothetical protein
MRCKPEVAVIRFQIEFEQTNVAAIAAAAALLYQYSIEHSLLQFRG